MTFLIMRRMSTMVKVRPHDYLKSRSVFTVAIENLADATDRSIGITIPPRDQVPMGVVDGLTGGSSDVGADVHAVATGLLHDAIHLLAEEDPECVQIVTVTGGEIDRVSLGDDQGMARSDGVEILDGEVMHVLTARSRLTFLEASDQPTESATRRCG